jgi:hypothetical protein
MFHSSYWNFFIVMWGLEYFCSFVSWFTLSILHPFDVSKFVLEFCHWNVRHGIFLNSFFVAYLITVTFCLCFKVHFEIYSSNCKIWNIFIVLFRGLPCHCYSPLMFQSSFQIFFVEMKDLEYFFSVLSWFTLSPLYSEGVSTFILEFFR